MKTKLLKAFSMLLLFLISNVNFAQAPPMGTLSSFALFSTAGAITSSSTPIYLTHVTGNIGAAPASISRFGNVDGVMYQGGTEFNQGAIDLLVAYDSLNAQASTNALASPFGAGVTLSPGVHSISAASQLTGDLILDAGGNANAVFIFQLGGAFSTAANAKVKLINQAQACNVFWKVDGLVDMGAGTTMRGTIIAKDFAITMGSGDTLEGRAFAINGAISLDLTKIYTPSGCGIAPHLGPTAPTLASTACYAIFSSVGNVTNAGITNVVGDVGTNTGVTLGYDTSLVTGTVHLIPDASTGICKTDLDNVYAYLNALLPGDITLTRPDLFGHNLVLTPHTYSMGGAVSFTDSIYLNAEGNANAVFVIMNDGAFTSTVNSKVILINGAQAKNVFWKIDGAVNLAAGSIFNGTIISASTINLYTGAIINGRALTTAGDYTTSANDVTMTAGCSSTGITSFENTNEAVLIYPNPFSTSATITINNIAQIKNCELKMYNVLGEQIMNNSIANQTTTLDTSNLPSGVYFYKVIGNNKTIQAGKLVAQ